MNYKELKAFYSEKTLGEVRGKYDEALRIATYHKEQIRKNAQELAELDFNHKNYADKAKNLMNDISFYKKDIQEDEKELTILKPILDKKEAEGLNEQVYIDYMTKNKANIQVLVDEVEKRKQELIDGGCKASMWNGKEWVAIDITINEINYIFDGLLKETVFLIKDNIGDLKEVKYLRGNDHRGFDGLFLGTKGNIEINTIMAGGYNIQKLHYRTLVFKRMFD